MQARILPNVFSFTYWFCLYISLRGFYVQSVPFHIRLSPRFRAKNTHIMLEKPIIFCKNIFTMALYNFFKWFIFLKFFYYSRENRNLDPITIRYDVGHPVILVPCSQKFPNDFSGNFPKPFSGTFRIFRNVP